MDIKELLQLMKALRNPETGCPWDLKQNFESIVPYTIEEVYEVAEAIDTGDRNELKLELGDLLFQIAFYTQLAEEEGSLSFADVVAAVVEKMTRRHPHVFGDVIYESEEAFKKDWDKKKREEKLAAGLQVETLPSALDGVSKALPALKVAQKVQVKAARVNFDWQSVEPVYEKIQEEIAEVKQAQQEGPAKIEEEVGDLLFAVVNLARHLNLDAENALRKATNKFEKRFRQLEHVCQQQGIELQQQSEEQLETIWQQVKKLD